MSKQYRFRLYGVLSLKTLFSTNSAGFGGKMDLFKFYGNIYTIRGDIPVKLFPFPLNGVYSKSERICSMGENSFLLE